MLSREQKYFKKFFLSSLIFEWLRYAEKYICITNARPFVLSDLIGAFISPYSCSVRIIIKKLFVGLWTTRRISHAHFQIQFNLILFNVESLASKQQLVALLISDVSTNFSQNYIELYIIWSSLMWTAKCWYCRKHNNNNNWPI